MAEIKIEKKKPVWPWIVLILLIIVGAYVFWAYNDQNKNVKQDDVITDTIPPMNDNQNDIEVETTSAY